MTQNNLNLKICNLRTDGGTQPRAEMDLALVAEYADDMSRGDVFPPVLVVYDGENHWLVDGFHRTKAAGQAGFETISAKVEQGTIDDARWMSLGANAQHGKRRSRADKQRAIKKALKGWGAKKSNSEIATHVGCSHPTVGKHRRELESEGKIQESAQRVGADGRKINTANIGTNQNYSDTQTQNGPGEPLPTIEHNTDDLPTGGEDVGGYNTDDDADNDGDKIHQVAANSGNGEDGNEWYTPEEYIESARKAMGSIDVDPASNPTAQAVVKAATWYGKEDDGLSKKWHGNVFVNPPYSYPLVEHFVDKLIEEFKSGRTKQAIILVNNCTDTKWFHKLLGHYPVCFTLGRVQFWRENQERFATRQGQAFFYLGHNVPSFTEVFSEHGEVLVSAGRGGRQ